MSKPTPQREMLKELKRKAIRKQKRFEALPAKIAFKKRKKQERENRKKIIPYIKNKK